jgi:hypothetical protein
VYSIINAVNVSCVGSVWAGDVLLVGPPLSMLLVLHPMLPIPSSMVCLCGTCSSLRSQSPRLQSYHVVNP